MQDQHFTFMYELFTGGLKNPSYDVSIKLHNLGKTARCYISLASPRPSATHPSKWQSLPWWSHSYWLHYCSIFTTLWFIPPIFIERIKSFQYRYKFFCLHRGAYNLITSICSFSQDTNKIIFCLKEITSEEMKALSKLKSLFNYFVFLPERSQSCA